MENMVIARFKDNETTAETDRLRQWDYGQTLRIEGLSLPDMVEVHFSIRDVGGDAERQIGTTKDGVTEVVIPDKMLENKHCKCSEYTIYAWVYLSDEVSGQTEYDIRIPVETRSRPVNFAPSNQPDFAGKVMEKLNDVETLKADFDGLKKESDERDKQKLTRPASAEVGQIFRVQAVNEDGTLTLEAVDMPECDVTDVQIDGTSIVGENGVAEIPKLKESHYNNILYGLPALNDGNEPVGIGIAINGSLMTLPARRKDIKNRVERDYFDIAVTGADFHNPICPGYIDYAVKAAMCDGKGAAWTAEEQAAARERMSAEKTFSGNVVFDETIAESIAEMKITVPEGWNNILLQVLYPKVGSAYEGGIGTGSVYMTAGKTNNPYNIYVYLDSIISPTYTGRRVFFNFNLIKRGIYAELNRYLGGTTAQATVANSAVLESLCAYSDVEVIKFAASHIPEGTQFILYVD